MFLCTKLVLLSYSNHIIFSEGCKPFLEFLPYESEEKMKDTAEQKKRRVSPALPSVPIDTVCIYNL